LTERRPLRILQVAGGLNRGGAETWLMHVLRHIDRERFHMDFLVHTTQPGAYDDEARSLGSKVIPCLDPKRPWVYASNFRRILREHGPYDIVHSHVYLFDGFPLWLAAREGVKGRISNIYPLTDTQKQDLRRAIYRWIATRLISRYATMIVTDSHHSLEAFKVMADISRRPSTVVYCGIDLQPFDRQVDRLEVRKCLSLPADKPVITYVARFVPHKNHRQVVRVADRLNRHSYRYHFAMAGSHGPLLETIRDSVRGRQDISMLTGLKDISDLLLASDLFFFPSLEEGFGIVAVEASAAGLPVVATDLPTIREACAPGLHRFMFPADDDEVASRNISTILGDARLKQQLGAEARQWSQRFSIARSVDKLVSIYNLYQAK
jgi:glycosyltransferase involved in cell wall biosynthesis